MATMVSFKNKISLIFLLCNTKKMLCLKLIILDDTDILNE